MVLGAGDGGWRCIASRCMRYVALVWIFGQPGQARPGLTKKLLNFAPRQLRERSNGLFQERKVGKREDWISSKDDGIIDFDFDFGFDFRLLTSILTLEMIVFKSPYRTILLLKLYPYQRSYRQVYDLTTGEIERSSPGPLPFFSLPASAILRRRMLIMNLSRPWYTYPAWILG
ncbi:hypothetical protein BKA61DRAFT_97354 [Leptodontidium sp. MPI-SDFR-AT-0119]|nr:hypothetical protein BKA61DRAFT_97354 [Leptodontidium sp. MPI-SDFR-AT-0119]